MSTRWTASYHTHNQFCDGQGAIDEVVEAAIAAGLTQVGISSHAPLPFPSNWTMPLERLDEYFQTVREAGERYRDRIRVLLASELDYIPDEAVLEFQRREILSRGFDYFVGSVHYLGDLNPPLTYDASEDEFRLVLESKYDGSIEALIVDYYERVREMLSVPQVRIVGHIDRIKQWSMDGRYFRQDAAWYRSALEETLQAIARSGHIVVLNTGGWYKGVGEAYPAPWVLARCRDLGIPILISSDSHTPQLVAAEFDRAQACLDDLGITPVYLGA